ncbi:MAG: dicarboxylate/amino acid:cation symporter [bacterium]
MADILAGLNGYGFWGMSALVFALLFFLGRVLKMPLWLQVMVGLVLGGLAGYLVGDTAAVVKPVGDTFVKLIRMIVVPLIFTTLVAGVIAMGDPKRIGSLGAKTLSLYIVTTIIAVSLGLVVGSFIEPGVGVDPSVAEASDVSEISSRIDKATAAAGEDKTAWHAFSRQVLEVIPSNPLKAMSTGNILQIIFFALALGVGIIAAGERAGPLPEAMEGAAEAILEITKFVMALAPYGVYALMAWVIGTKGLGVIENLGKLALALYLACFLHIIFVHGFIIRVLNNLPFRKFIGGILDAMTTAYSTASSSATLPVTIANVSKNLGVKKEVAGSVLPLGATINMDGTSIYLGLVALFAAQALGINLEMADYVAIAATATLASIGTASIPSASLFLAYTVLSTFGVTEEQAILIIAFIFPFDRLLDMMRTATNVTGDAAVAVTVANWENAIDKDVFRGRK